jgi:2-oxo-4-hydroxy-4-carboxy-5-ureidoimidazoline decarboxylase
MATGNSLPTVSQLLNQTPATIVETLGGIYEHSAWVAEALVAKPECFTTVSTVSGLASLMKAIVDDAPRERKLALLQAHPDLCERVSTLKSLTKESQEEQSRSGLQSLSEDEAAEFAKNNEVYREKFGFPFILAVRNATKYTVLSALAGRVNSTLEQEFVTAVSQVHKIAWMRLLAKIDTSDAQGFLTCHVLDTCNGCPGEFLLLMSLSVWVFLF